MFKKIRLGKKMIKGRKVGTGKVPGEERKTSRIPDKTKRKIEAWLKNTNMNPRQVSELFKNVSPYQINFIAKRLELNMKNRQAARTEGGKKLVKAFFELKEIKIKSQILDEKGEIIGFRHMPNNIAKVIELWTFYNKVAPETKLTSEHYTVSVKKAKKLVEFCEKNNLDWKNVYYIFNQNIDTIKSRIDKVKSLLKPEATDKLNRLALFNLDKELNEFRKEKYGKMKGKYPEGIKSYIKALSINYLKNALKSKLGENPYFRNKISTNSSEAFNEIEKYARSSLSPEEKMLLVKLSINYECIKAISMGNRYLK